MSARDDEARRFEEFWPLHALRYGMIAAGVLAWLWAGAEGPGRWAVLLSAVMVLDLALYGPGTGHARPLWASLQLGSGVAAFLVAPGLAPGLVLLAVIAGIAGHLPLRWSLAALVLASGVTLWALPAELSSAFALTGGYGLAAWVGHLFAMHAAEVRQHRRTVAELEEAQIRLARLAETTRELAAAQERERLASEIHDTLGHALVGTLLQVQIARRLVASDPQAARERLELVEQNVRGTLDQVRQLLRRGRRDLHELTLPAALENLAADFEAAGGPKVELVFLPDPASVADLSPQVTEVLYRAAQEAMTNAVRHGRATCIRLEAEAAGPRLYLRIHDDGVGADQYTPGMGLTGMVRRVQSVGGTLRFETGAQKGFLVEVGVRRR